MNDFINLNYFKFNCDDNDIKNFINYFNNSLDNFIYHDTFIQNNLNSNHINKKEIFLKFKETILRYINY